jgi:hypothetical protein
MMTTSRTYFEGMMDGEAKDNENFVVKMRRMRVKGTEILEARPFGKRPPSHR